MGKTKTKIIDDSVEEPSAISSQPSDEQKPSTKAAQPKGSTPKDALAASLLAELTEEFEEVEAKPEKPSTKAVATPGEEKEKRPSTQAAQAKKAVKTKVKPRGKKYLEAVKDVDKHQKYELKEAVDMIQKRSYTKFPGTVEIHINTNVKNIRGLISLPFASGKKLTILAFGKGAEDSGADIVGNDAILETVVKGKVEADGKKFDVVITTSEWMPKLAKAARVLGPRGMMPNPKNGTILDDLKKSVGEVQGGKVEYKSESNGQVIHLGIGKVTQPVEEITANVKMLYSTIGKSKIRKIVLSPTMGPGVKVDLASI